LSENGGGSESCGMSLPFYLVYRGLVWLSEVTGFSYEEINIIVYYILIPGIFFALIDKILKRPVCLGLFALVLAIAFVKIDDFSKFSDLLFDGSVSFLLSFSGLGVGYDAASVLICVLLPFLFFLFLLSLAFPSFFRKTFPTLMKACAAIKNSKDLKSS
jgi:hypothetical protein